MFLEFFIKLKASNLPVSLNEYLTLLKALQLNFIQYDIEEFYFLTRTTLIKNENLIDKFDVIFGEHFKSIEKIQFEDVAKFFSIPNHWIEKLFEKEFSKEEMLKIKSSGGFKKLMEKFKKRLEEQKKRHEGGNKWIGTSGTSQFGAYGYNPMGIRIGQSESRHRKALKTWDKRRFKDFDDSKQLNSRGLQVSLKHLRQWARTSIEEEIDIKNTINFSAKNGYLDIKKKKQKENSLKVILFLDVGGSMDDHIKKVESLFFAAKSVFKNLEYFYFHNCLYEGVWKDNKRRWSERSSTNEIIRTYGKDFKCIFVGDASMSPYEILMPGASNEHYNQESGKFWLSRALSKWSSSLWINPVPENKWQITESISIIKKIFSNRMVPLTPLGIKEGTKLLSKRWVN
tara:strand:- start:28497 stop:29693 length:1197 start_codon:yes stop_codon:yes gene_type:complete